MAAGVYIAGTWVLGFQLTSGDSSDSWLSKKGNTCEILEFSNSRTPGLSGKGIECLLEGVVTLLQKRQKRYWKEDSKSSKCARTSKLMDSTNWEVKEGGLRIRTKPARWKFAIWQPNEEEKTAAFITSKCTAWNGNKLLQIPGIPRWWPRAVVDNGLRHHFQQWTQDGKWMCDVTSCCYDVAQPWWLKEEWQRERSESCCWSCGTGHTGGHTQTAGGSAGGSVDVPHSGQKRKNCPT